MPHVVSRRHPVALKLPYRGRGVRAQRNSQAGAAVAITRAGSQASRMLLQYMKDGPSSDLQLAKALGLPESRISARRSGLMDRGLVGWFDDVEGPCGAPNGRYRLTPRGVYVVSELLRERL